MSQEYECPICGYRWAEHDEDPMTNCVITSYCGDDCRRSDERSDTEPHPDND